MSDEVRTLWRASEDRLYAAAAGDRETYATTLDVLGAVVDALRAAASTVQGLERAAADPDALVAALGLRPPLPAAVVVGAACATVARALDAADSTRRRDELVAAARAEGREWVVLEGPSRTDDLTSGQRVVLHVASGRVLVASVDPWSGDVPFVLEEPDVARAAYGSPPEWLAAAAEWEARIAREAAEPRPG